MNHPVLFNPWKHHKAFILESIDRFAEVEGETSLLRSGLLMIGNSVSDLYLGNMTVPEIENNAIELLKSHQRLSLDAFKLWLASAGNYRVLEFKDSSLWTFRLGESIENYVHIHPARYSPHTVRVKAQSLKTAIASLILCRRLNRRPSLDLVNQARTSILNLSPLKAVDKGLARMLSLFGNGNSLQSG